LAAGAIALAVTAAPVLATTYQCNISRHRGNNTWIADTMVLRYDPAGGWANVVDGITKEVWESPVPAEVTEPVPGKLVFRWELNNLLPKRRKPAYTRVVGVAKIIVVKGRVEPGRPVFTSPDPVHVEGSRTCRISR
jgi:hypothetical protein